MPPTFFNSRCSFAPRCPAICFYSAFVLLPARNPSGLPVSLNGTFRTSQSSFPRCCLRPLLALQPRSLSASSRHTTRILPNHQTSRLATSLTPFSISNFLYPTIFGSLVVLRDRFRLPIATQPGSAHKPQGLPLRIVAFQKASIHSIHQLLHLQASALASRSDR